MTTHIIGLEEIHAPRGIQLGYRIVIGLGTGFGGVHAPHVWIPTTPIVFVRDVGGVIRSTLDRKVLIDRLTWNATHDVDPEFQSLAVDVICERFESGAVRG